MREYLSIYVQKRLGYSIIVNPPVLCESINQLVGARRVAVITTPTVWRLHGDSIADCKFAYDLIVVSVDEQSKSLRQVSEVCERLFELSFPRDGIILAFGGGVCTDLAAFVAGIYRRGVQHIRVPTTLVGQVDAGIGIKCGVNLNSTKSALGSFEPPIASVVDRSFLATLSRGHICHGFSEIIKLAVVSDVELFSILEENYQELIESNLQSPSAHAKQVHVRSIRGMINELRSNLFEDQSYERLVDFGHTLSPIIESSLSYSIHHTFAVAIDMAFCAVLSRFTGLLSESDCNRVIKLLEAVGLPITCDSLTVELVYEAFGRATANRGGSLNLVLPTRIGQGTFLKAASDLSDGVISAAIGELKRRSLGEA